MLTLLSPAKSLDPSPHEAGIPATEPRFPDQSEKLLKAAKKLKAKHLAELMDISKALSELNYARYQGFEAQAEMSAVFLFNGDVYDGLQARTLDNDALAFAQAHLRLLSGLYGCLRPLDLIRPYRLEMGTALKVGRAHSLYQFWGDTLAESLRAEAGDGGLLNLASQEYAKAALTKKLSLPVVSPRFLEIKGNEAKIISFFAKKARGLMARYIVDQRIDRPEGVKDFNVDGYAFRPDLSHEGDWVFTRQQPALKAA
ncbi:peroxide stress protein YaaA [Asticcacaulis sp. EMRT-3]|uniref:peroxide stress protein YaaA n=1 Tax=Asticcacaulis sp. EMRT-3 TaxID=3040349 RepID=UPI0024AFFF11|nr:peroxide stress protein YaaA [Asticcacaulis sp. EMRT-3]MDI7774624.1 peroxide stress protein YaaA [Asticcacaulis sp. EMRT-3]